PWIDKRIFPGAYPPTLRQMMDIFEPNGLSVLDVENIRLHYAETLRAWLARYEENVDKVRAMFDETFVRAWRLYLAGSIMAFVHGKLQLFLVVFARTGMNDIPWTRAHVYERGLGGERARRGGGLRAKEGAAGGELGRRRTPDHARRADD